MIEVAESPVEFTAGTRVLVGHSKEPGTVRSAWRIQPEAWHYIVDLDNGTVISDLTAASLTPEVV